ncbi:helix-turn-helix domain-containing protein [Patescibacteria group bacterium]|nr:helix-turn-helix domain-containing protein [Patescibacteria group bacterium]
MLMVDQIYTTEQVANILQIHHLTVLKYIKQGKLHGIKLGRIYRIRESDLQNFLNQESF